jgi:hypothetical protein
MLTRLLRPTRHEQGYVLVWVLFYFLLLYLIAISLADISLLEGLISVNYRQAAQAYEMAEGGVLVGVKEVYDILHNDYSNSPDIPTELTLPKQEWVLNEAGREMRFYLENPKRVYVGASKCRFKFSSKGVCSPAQRVLVAEVEVEFLDVYKVAVDGTLVFDRREFISPGKVVLFQYKGD